MRFENPEGKNSNNRVICLFVPFLRFVWKHLEEN